MPTLEITTKLGCALACWFCPQDRLVKSYPRDAARMLSLEAFRGVLDTVPPHVRIDFSGMAEPWLNPDATAMVTETFERGRKAAIYTTLQGMAPPDAAALIARFGNRITPETPWVIHLPDQEGNMTGWRPSGDYFASLAAFADFHRAGAPPGLSFMTMSADGTPAEPVRAVFGAQLAPFVGISRAENLDRGDFSPGRLLEAAGHGGAILCGSTPFFDHNTMLPNGDVVLCCMDYGRRHVLGNLFQQSYAEIFSAPAMGAIRTQAMTPDGELDALICRRCHNAVRLDQAGGTHWRLAGDAMWVPRTAAREVPPRAGRASKALSWLLQRA